MKIINYLSSIAIPCVIIIVIIYGLLEKNKVYDTFLEGAKEGIEIVVKLFPTLLGIFMAIGVLRGSGILDFVTNLFLPITKLLNIPSEIMPLVMLRPLSGGGSTAIGTDIMTKYGVDSKIGLIASTIMGSTETTFYIISIYTSSVGVKKIKYVLVCSLIGDIVRNVSFCSNLGIFVGKFFLTKLKS